MRRWKTGSGIALPELPEIIARRSGNDKSPAVGPYVKPEVTVIDADYRMGWFSIPMGEANERLA